MLRCRFDAVRTILCLGAHADDIEIGCGGTIMRLLTQHPSAKVHWVVLSGNGARAGEARRSATMFLRDARDPKVVVKRYRDGVFSSDCDRMKSYFDRLGHACSPDLVFTHRREDAHQDHRFVAELTWQTFRDQLILEYEIPKYDGDLGQPNVFMPLDEPTCRRKVKTILASFKTQRPKQWFSDDTFWALLRLRGVESNSPTRFAEALLWSQTDLVESETPSKSDLDRGPQMMMPAVVASGTLS